MPTHRLSATSGRRLRRCRGEMAQVMYELRLRVPITMLESARRPNRAADGRPRYGGDQRSCSENAAKLDSTAEMLQVSERLNFLYHAHMYMTQQIQFADVKASGVLVAEGAVLAYVVTMLWYGWPGIRGTALAVPALICAVACIALQGVGVVANLLCVWPRVWRTGNGDGCNLLDFYTCSMPHYRQLIQSAHPNHLIEALTEAVSRSAAVAARKHALMRIAVAATLIGGAPAVLVLWLLRPLG